MPSTSGFRSSSSTLADGPHARIVITIASLGFFLITLDISIVNVALTRMRAELSGGTTGQQWVIDGYTLLLPRRAQDSAADDGLPLQPKPVRIRRPEDPLISERIASANDSGPSPTRSRDAVEAASGSAHSPRSTLSAIGCSVVPQARTMTRALFTKGTHDAESDARARGMDSHAEQVRARDAHRCDHLTAGMAVRLRHRRPSARGAPGAE